MKRLLIILLLATVAAALPAFDWGGYLDNTTGIADAPVGAETDVLLVQSTTVALWVNTPLGGWSLDAEGSYTFTPSVPLLFDLDRLTIGTDVIAEEAGATTFGFSAGRDSYASTTGYVLNHTLDGVRIQISQASSSLRFGLGTTALLQKPTNQIVLSTADILDLADPEVLFAPPRLIGVLDYRMLEVFGGQHLNVGVTFNEDLRPQDQLTPIGTELQDPTASGKFETQYVTLALSGALGPGLFHRTYYTLNSGRELAYVPDSDSGTGSSYQYEVLLAHMAGAELTWFLPQTLNSRARVFGQFTTGPTEWSDSFVPLSPTTYSDVFSLEPGNSAHLGVSYSLRPLAALGTDVLQTEVRSVAYFRSAGTGEVSEPSVDPATSGAYVGTDANLILTAVPFSDLRIVLKGGLFVPNASVMSPDNENVDYQVTLQGVLRF